MRECVLLSRMTGWGLGEVLALDVPAFYDWLDAAIQLERESARYPR